MRVRFYFLLLLFAIVIIIWSAYLFCIQLIDPLNLEHYRQVRYKSEKEILVPTRGSILDGNGTLFVSSVIYYQADIDRKQVSLWAKKSRKSLENTYKLISQAFAKYTTITEKEVYDKLTKNQNLSAVQIYNKIKESELECLIQHFKSNNLPGFTYSFNSMKRIYSRGINAARLLGSVDETNSEYNPEEPMNSMYQLKGSNGLEATYNAELAGQTGWREVMFDANKNRVPYPGLHDRKQINGLNMWLTIDSSIQDVVEEALAEGLQKYGAKNAAAVVMDVNSGKIYAMAGVSADDYSEDPGFVRVKSNIPVSFLFEPGSTMKPFTMMTALDNNLIKPRELFSSGSRKVGARIISDTHHYGAINARDIIAYSSNVGISLIGDRVGSRRLYDKLLSLGYGQKTNLNLFGESSGVLHKLENWDGYSLHSITFGYAISVTAMQLAAAYSVAANGGNYVKPYIVESFRDETGKVVKAFEPKTIRRVVSQAAADTLKSYLQSVVEKGTAKHIKLNYITMAGKTGTAQKKIEGQAGYATGKYTGNFVGFFPVDKPEMVIVVVYDEPEYSMRFGGLCAAPTFRKIVEGILFLPSCKILPKNKQMLQQSALTPNLTGMTVFTAERLLKQNGLIYNIEYHDSSSVIIDQYPKPDVSLDRSHAILLVTGKPNQNEETYVRTGIMPDLTGLTLRKALQLSSQNKIKLKINGMGTVQRQSIIAGTKIIPGCTCIVDASL
jgi:cell division protein FtsI/penicillin-binding protein 2